MKRKKNDVNTASGGATSPVLVDWSELPNDLIRLISERLDHDFQLICFRSVCSSWRSFSVSNLITNNLPFNFPLKIDSDYHSDSDDDSDSSSDDSDSDSSSDDSDSDSSSDDSDSDSSSDDDSDSSSDDFDSDSDSDDDTDSESDDSDSNDNNTTNMSFCSLSKRHIFLIKPQQQQTLNDRPFLVRVPQNSSAKTKLSRSQFLPFNLPCPFSVDLTKFSIHHFGTDFITDKSLSLRYIHPLKVIAVTPLVLAILLDSENLVLLCRGEECWIEIPYMTSCIGDICIFKGRIYAVEKCSFETVTLALEDWSVEKCSFETVTNAVEHLSVQVVAKNVIAKKRKLKYLVASEGELLLVDICDSSCFDAFKIDVYRLDEKDKEWVKLTSLRNRVLFLSDGCSFSASALDLCVTKGNYIIFMEDFILGSEMPRNMICDSGMYIFDMDQLQLFPLRRYPQYFNLFRA